MGLLIIGIVLIIAAIVFGISDKSWVTFGTGLIVMTILFILSFIFSLIIGCIAYEVTPIENTIVSTETWSVVWSEEANDYIVLNTQNKIMGALSDYDDVTLSNEVDSIKVYCDICVFDSVEWLNGPLSRVKSNRVRVIMPIGG